MIPKTMKAAVLHEFGKPLKIEEVPVKTPGPHEVLVNLRSLPYRPSCL
jgi:propanol-preferring alcohol dehydrogenase